MNCTRAKPAGDGAGEGLGEQRLADAREVLDDEVAAGQQGHDAGSDHLVLAEDHRGDVGFDALGAPRDLAHLLVLEGGAASGVYRHVLLPLLSCRQLGLGLISGVEARVEMAVLGGRQNRWRRGGCARGLPWCDPRADPPFMILPT